MAGIAPKVVGSPGMPNMAGIVTNQIAGQTIAPALQGAPNVGNAFDPDAAPTVAGYDPNQAPNMQNMYDFINQEYARNMMAPVSAVLNPAVAATSGYDPQSAALEDMRESNGNAGHPGVGSLQGAVAGLLKGLQLGAQGSLASAGGTNPTGAAGSSQLDTAKFIQAKNEKRMDQTMAIVKSYQDDTTVKNETERYATGQQLLQVLEHPESLQSDPASVMNFLKMYAHLYFPGSNRPQMEELDSATDPKQFFAMMQTKGLPSAIQDFGDALLNGKVIPSRVLNTVLNNVKTTLNEGANNMAKSYGTAAGLLKKDGYSDAEVATVLQAPDKYGFTATTDEDNSVAYTGEYTPDKTTDRVAQTAVKNSDPAQVKADKAAAGAEAQKLRDSKLAPPPGFKGSVYDHL